MTDIVDIGDLPNDGTGDPLRVAFDKINNNFTVLANLAPHGPNGAIQFKNGDFPNGTANLVYDVANNIINFGGNIVPSANSNVALGSSTSKIDKLYLKQDSLRIGNVSVSEIGNVLSFPVTVNSSTKASLSANNVTVEGNLTVSGEVIISGLRKDRISVNTQNNTANQIIFETPVTEFKQGTFTVVSKQASPSNNTQSVILEITVNTSGSAASYVAYGTTFIGSPVTRYNTDVAYGNVRVMVSPIPNIPLTHDVTYEIKM